MLQAHKNNGTTLSSGYRYSFNGKEKIDEVSGSGNSIDFGARIYDCRVGRWLSRDPFQMKYPQFSPYKSMKNNPVIYSDPDGRDEIIRIFIYDYDNDKTYVYEIYNDNNLVLTDGQCTDEEILNGHTTVIRQQYFNYTSNYSIYIKDEKVTVSYDGREINQGELKDEDVVIVSGYDDGDEPRWHCDACTDYSGDGDVQNGGINLVSREGGADPTKYQSKNNVETTEVSGLLTMLGISGASPSNIYERMQEYVAAVEHAIQAQEEYESNTGSNTNETSGSADTDNNDNDTTVQIYTFHQEGGAARTEIKDTVINKSDLHKIALKRYAK